MSSPKQVVKDKSFLVKKLCRKPPKRKFKVKGNPLPDRLKSPLKNRFTGN